MRAEVNTLLSQVEEPKNRIEPNNECGGNLAQPVEAKALDRADLGTATAA
jgi:hypothetical protein